MLKRSELAYILESNGADYRDKKEQGGVGFENKNENLKLKHWLTKSQCGQLVLIAEQDLAQVRFEQQTCGWPEVCGW